MSDDAGYSLAKLTRDVATAIATAEGKTVNWSSTRSITGEGVDRAYILKLFYDSAQTVREIYWLKN